MFQSGDISSVFCSFTRRVNLMSTVPATSFLFSVFWWKGFLGKSQEAKSTQNSRGTPSISCKIIYPITRRSNMDNKQRLKCFAFLGCGSLHGEHAGSSSPVIYLQSEVKVLHADCPCPCSSFNEIDVQQMYQHGFWSYGGLLCCIMYETSRLCKLRAIIITLVCLLIVNNGLDQI